MFYEGMGGKDGERKVVLDTVVLERFLQESDIWAKKYIKSVHEPCGSVKEPVSEVGCKSAKAEEVLLAEWGGWRQ